MKISSKILLSVSGALLAVFAVKNIIDYSRYTKTVNSAPFDIRISLNALVLVVPAALLAAIALFSEKKTRVLAICTAVFAAISIEEIVRQITVLDGLLLAIPYLASAVIILIMTLISSKIKNRGKE